MELDPSKAEALDQTLARYTNELREAGADNAVATLGYTHGIHRIWRQVVRMLPIPPDSAVLDVGTGFGLLPFELAANAAVDVDAVDLDPEFIEHAQTLEEQLAGQEFFDPGSSLAFTVGDAVNMHYPDASFDLVFVREVLQFVPDPVAAAREIQRLLRPGGFACVGDTDDQLRITWPPSSPALTRLVDAAGQVQHSNGGDRQTGRKLSTYLSAAGLAINSLVVLPEAQHRLVGSDDIERGLILDQLKAVRSLVITAGAITAEQFDADVAELEQAEPFEEFRMNARIIVLAQRPA